MGILITPARNKFEAQAEARGEKRGEARGEKRGEARGEKRGEARGRRDMAVRSAEWFAQMQQAHKEGREFHKPPPWEEDEDRAKR